MKAVSFAWDLGKGPFRWFDWPISDAEQGWICANIDEGERLWVRMDNGQLCKFRRKEPK